MIERLELAASLDPSRVAIITNDRTITYDALTQLARQVGAGLSARGISRFGVVDQDAVNVVALLAGASMVGAQACVYPPLDATETPAELAGRFDHDIVVSDEPALDGDFEILSLAALTENADAGAAADLPAERPLLVLTTGTTGTPRGVRHDWWRVARSTAHVAPAPDQRWLLAFGLHQFAGLQILVHVTAAGATLVAPAPRRPREGLAAMRAHGVGYASATPTFWRFLLAEARSDGGGLPSLEQITVGGEAVPDHLLGELGEAFPEARISQIYAANESGSTGSVRDGRNGLPVSILERGENADVAFKIVDGELWVRSRIGMLGYYGEPPVQSDAWRATGDLVDVEGDRIYFRGRTSEIINVGGVKVHPLPIEEAIGRVDGVAMARVFGRPNAMTGAIVAVEVIPEDGVDTDELDGAIREACADLPAASRPRSIRFVDAITTKGGKIIRRAD